MTDIGTETPGVETPRLRIVEGTEEGDVPPKVYTSEGADAPKPRASRRDRGALEASVKQVCDSWLMGTFELQEGQYLTPYRIGRRIKDVEGRSVSTGAVSAVIERWIKWGVAEEPMASDPATGNKIPRHFAGYTQQAAERGIDALRREYRKG